MMISRVNRTILRPKITIDFNRRTLPSDVTPGLLKKVIAELQKA